MDNSMYIVKAFDKVINKPIEYEFINRQHATETYNMLKGQQGLENLIMAEYDVITKQYHLVEI